jgi:hypothetical protein
VPPLLFNQIIAFDGIAMAAAKVRGHQLGTWQFQDGHAAASCTRCGRRLVVYYAPLQPDIGGSALLHGCKRASAELSPPGERNFSFYMLHFK